MFGFLWIRKRGLTFIPLSVPSCLSLFIYYLFSNWLINVSPFSLNSWHMVLYDLSRNIYEGLTYVGMGSVFPSLLAKDLTQSDI